MVRVDIVVTLNLYCEVRGLNLGQLTCSQGGHLYFLLQVYFIVNPLKPELNPICYLLALLGAHHFLHVSRIRVKLLTLR